MPSGWKKNQADTSRRVQRGGGSAAYEARLPRELQRTPAQPGPLGESDERREQLQEFEDELGRSSTPFFCNSPTPTAADLGLWGAQVAP